jgi:hypothetical protein
MYALLYAVGLPRIPAFLGFLLLSGLALGFG